MLFQTIYAGISLNLNVNRFAMTRIGASNCVFFLQEKCEMEREELEIYFCEVQNEDYSLQ